MYFKTEFNVKTKIWCGPNTKPLFHPDITIGQVALDIADLIPSKICQISADDGYHLTFGEIRKHIIRIALNLRDQGLKKGDVISVVAGNSRHVAALVFGCFLIGVTVNTMDPFFTTSEMLHGLSLSQPTYIFCDENNLETVCSALALAHQDAKIVVFNGTNVGYKNIHELLETHPEEQEFIIPDLGDISELPALILCSSGTTGLPKGVCLSHMTLLAQLRKRWTINSEDVQFSFSSLYWMSGWIILLSGQLNGVTRVITRKSFAPDLMLHLIETYRLTTIFTAPYQMMLMTQSDKVQQTCFDSIRLLLVGGSMVSDSLQVTLSQLIKNGTTVVCYGATEIGGFIASTLGFDRTGSVGQITLGTAIKLVDDDGRQMGINEIGEICGKSDYPFLGYKNNVEATLQAIDADGWTLTGDLGYFDEAGFLFLVDRKKDIIKYRNHQISPSEIEAVIEQIPDVLTVSVIGIPDAVSTDLPAAVIVRKPNSKLTEAEVIQFTNDQVSDQKQLRGGVYFVERLPLTYSGKIMRREVKRLAIEMHVAGNLYKVNHK